ncbi:hypothetical protein FD755_015617, partial [Muntiacus reevesi]
VFNLYLLGVVFTLFSINLGDLLESPYPGSPWATSIGQLEPTQSPLGPSKPSIQKGVIKPPSTGYNLRTLS